MNLNEVDDLIEAFVEGELDEFGQQKLNDEIAQNPELGIRLARASKNDLFLKQMLARDKETESKIIKITNRRKKAPKSFHNQSGWFWPTIYSVASCLIFGLSIVWLSSLNQTDQNSSQTFVEAIQETVKIKILALEGEVMVTRGTVKKYVMLGDHLAQNDILECQTESRLKFKLMGENTIYHLDPESRLIMMDDKGKSWKLDYGNVGASVAKQSPGSKINFKTDHANIDVLGTILQVQSSTKESRLSVFEGAVKMKKLADENSIIVKEGFYATTKSDHLKPMRIGVSDKEDIQIVALSLINAEKKRPFLGYDYKENLGVITLKSLPSKKFNLDIHTEPKVIGSVKFSISGPNGFKVSKVESFYPYTLGNKDESLSPFDLPNYDKYDLVRGEYTIEATPYTKVKQEGRQGPTKVFKFTVK
jgi:hypothetical protein